jgi:hypothetical protein
MPEIRQINEQVADGALVQLCQFAEVVESGGMSSTARPLLPVRKGLEGLQLIRPAPVPFIGGLALAPFMGVAEGYPCIETVALPESFGDFHSRLALGPQRTHQLLALLLLTAWLTNRASSTSWRLTP